MSRKLSKKLNIDTRTASDIENRISELSNLYDTGWHFDAEDPDIGTAIAKIYAGEMEENISRVNDILGRYHTEFVNMLDISLLPAKPSAGFVVMDVTSDTVEGTGVPKGTKLLATTGKGDLVFETDHSVYVTGSKIVSAFMTDGEEATFAPLLGDYHVPRIYGDGGIVKEIPEEEAKVLGEEEEGDEFETPMVVAGNAYETEEVIREREFKPFTLFGRMEGIGMDAIIFYHKFLFDVFDDEIFIRFSGAEELVKEIKQGKYTFKYVSEDGLLPVDHVGIMPDEETFVLKKDKETLQVPVGADKTCLLALVANEKIKAVRKATDISFSAEGKNALPQSVANDSNDLDIDRFLPFTDNLAVYNECYIGHDRFFAKEGAKITVSFDLSFEINRITLRNDVEDKSLKIIKRKPKNRDDEVFAEAFVDEVAIEYYNGIGWKKLQLFEDLTTVFSDETARHVEFSFICPDDWEEVEAGAYEGRSIRLQVTRSDNCYLFPSLHHYPVITDLRISYSFEDSYLSAEKTEMITGTRRIDLTNKKKKRSGTVLFSVSDYKEDALYLGFSGRIDKGPVSILFELEEGIRYNGLPVFIEYSAPEGSFKRIKVIDYTGEFTKTGVIAFVPPSDWVCATIEGKKNFWLRIIRTRRELRSEDSTVLPKIKSIQMNAVQASNVQTKEEENVYIGEVVPDMRFTINATGILNADVWVNEMGRYSQEKMREMKNDDPDNIRIEEDMTGVIISFFVLWHETERFETSEDKRVYMLDRLTNELIFGNGITTWIPRVTDDIAIKMSVRCCDGALGNVEADTITEPLESLPFVGTITNPNKSYGGSNIENIDTALLRGASILSSRKRLVTIDDYLRAIAAFSDTIDQTAGVVGQTVEGEINDSALTFLLLMKDFAEGSFAFHRVVNDLKNHLMEHCELTVVPEQLHLIEPIFVDISVDAWVTLVSLDDSFEIQSMLTECLDDYLNPLGYGDGSRGWKIGTLPKKPQILMRLGILKSRAIVRKSVMIATYTDHEGYHEVNLDDLKITPFMVCRSGKHEVHIVY